MKLNNVVCEITTNTQTLKGFVFVYNTVHIKTLEPIPLSHDSP